VYLLFDSDSAGRKATLRAMELLLSEQMPCFVIELPKGDDPDSYLANHSAQEFSELMKIARPALDYYLRELISAEDTGTVTGKKAVADQFRPFLQKLADPLERDLYLKELARLLSVDVRTFGSINRTPRANPESSSSSRVSASSADSLVAILFRYPEIAAEFRATGAEGLLPVALRKPAARIIDAAAKGENIEPADIIETDSPGLNTFAALIVDDSHFEDIDPFRAMHDLRKALERETLKMADAKSLQRELLNLDYESPRYREILETLNDLRNRKSQL
jgi:DNA primase